MITKCIAILAIAAQINAAVCGCDQSSIVLPSRDSNSKSSQIVLVSSGNSDSSSRSSESIVLKPFSSGSAFSEASFSAPITRNIVAKGKYPVALKNCGPTPDQQIPVSTSRVTAPVQEKPTVRLPATIPAPKTICHSCTCYKTIMRPRVQQQIITVPTVERYIETTHKPIVENIQYEAVPVNCESGSSSGSGLQFVELGSGSSSGNQVQVVEAPRIQAVQVPQIQAVQVPQMQLVEAPRVQAVQIPQVQVVEAPRIQTVQVPQVQTVQVPRLQSVEVPRVQVVEAPQIQTVQIPQVQSVEVPRVQVVEAPCVQSFQIPQVQTVKMSQSLKCSC